MNLSIKELSKGFDIAGPATSLEITRIETHFGYLFPNDYKEFLQITNGLEGIANDEYLVLWGTSELIELNNAYKVQDYLQNIIIIGSDGAEDAFAFDISSVQPYVVKLPFIGMGHIPNEKLADTFEHFLIPRLQRKGIIGRSFG